MERLYPVEEVAEAWSYSRRSIYRLIAQGKLKSVLLSDGARRIPESELDRYWPR